ncbi:MAG: tryptophan-rich sensory protein [Salinarimonas sp.]|nr:tryptophan-rich sensory protein [Salinarimonas sp.]
MRLAAAILPVVAAWGFAALATTPGTAWFQTLEKPFFNPPNWVFGPVWTLLYLAMIYAAWRILGLPASRRRQRALVLFYVQLGFNALWSVAFFTLQSPGFGLVVIAILLALILAMIVAFRPLDRVAAWLMVPYALWVAYASALNLGIVVLALP